MNTWLKNSRKLMAAFGAVAVMLVAGWQFGVSGTESTFSENDVAIELAIEGSGNLDCKVEVVDCVEGGGTRQICHVNGEGVQCTCGDSTTC